MKWQWFPITICVLIILFLGSVFWVGMSSVPHGQGEAAIPGLQQDVTVQFNEYADPAIYADSRADAFTALGYITARERMFQMDLMRRQAAGRLSEIFGKKTLAVDIWHRHLGFEKAARDIVQSLPSEQRQLLSAYVKGINAYLNAVTIQPFEFLALDYTPKLWREQDSILVGLNIFQQQNGSEAEERMLTVMNTALDEDIVNFLTPQHDRYNPSTLLLGHEESRESIIPVRAIKALQSGLDHQSITGLVDASKIQAGSNQWVVNKTEDGRALLANDMHLSLSVPNLWYQAELNYQDSSISGITLPGFPMIIAGSNGFIAWGFTNAQADVLDLVALTTKPGNSKYYKTAQGWKEFDVSTELIKVRGDADHQVKVKRTQWGPVSPKPLMGKEVSIQWSAFHPEAVNLDLTSMDNTYEMEKALQLFQNAGLPVLNVVLADHTGNIAWTLTGKLPERKNVNGFSSISWADGKTGWDGFVESESYPEVINPLSGILVTANNRVLAKHNEFEYGHNFGSGYRAARITELLQSKPNLTNNDMHNIQLDTYSEFYNFYQRLALSVLPAETIEKWPELKGLKVGLQKWDGHAGAESVGFGILVAFRSRLADTVFSSYLELCRNLEAGFKYHWYLMDTPLRLLLTRKIPETLPGKGQYADWDELIVDVLRQVAGGLEQQFPDSRLSDLTWGEMRKIRLKHPFSNQNEWLDSFLNMPEEPVSGCAHCVRVAASHYGASMRMVVSPGHEDEMILITPTGQSGHPLSTHYRDKFNDWVNGGLLKKDSSHQGTTLTLRPVTTW